MIKILLWIWQFPQNLVGFILSRFAIKVQEETFNDGSNNKIYFVKRLNNSGVSLGNYIVLGKVYDGHYQYKKCINHEHGHQKQSKMFGPLYLIFIGIPSLCVNIWNRKMHKKWQYEKRQKWYYSQYPEKWADKLGHVERYWGF